jgi:hypothetical protein
MYLRLLRIAFLLFLFSSFALRVSAQDKRILPSCPLNIIIAVDFSGSERAYIGEIQTAMRAITETFELSETHLKIGIITFNRGAEVVLPLTGDTEAMDEAIDALDLPTLVYATDIHAAFSLAKVEFQKNATPGVPNYFVLISDGDPHAHMRGHGFQADLINAQQLKAGDPETDLDPVHVFSLYTGRLSPYQNRFGEEIRRASIQHMQKLASDGESFFYYQQYPMLVEFFERVSNCL